MLEENDEKGDIGFKVTDRRFSNKTPEKTQGEKKTEEERGKIYEDEEGEQRKKSFKERLFGKKKAGVYDQGNMKSENAGNYISSSEIDFSSFILSLSTQAMMHLGEIPNPVTQKKEKELNLAKQTIDMIGMLKEKTAGNLAADEQQLIENLLYELRMKYIRETK